jgi:small subunit ribosomal protein S1
VGSDFVEGQVYEGKVVKIVDFGAFVELAPGVTGLVRLPNLARTRVEKASEAVAVGDAVQVRVLEIDTERERLDLGIRQALPEAEPKAEEESSVGTEIVGIIQQVGRQGLSLRLEDGREAWLSSRDVQLPPGVLLEQRFRRGGRVTARVVDVDRRSGKLRVTQSSSSESDEREAMRRFEKEQSKASNSLGTLADLLSGVKIGGR